MTTVIDYNEIKKELVHILRNSDVLTISQRTVTTKTDTGTFTAANNYTVSENKLKNVRSIEIDLVAQSYGTDYTYDVDTGIITFQTAQTGAYTIIFDYGETDRIFADRPQIGISLKQFPRIALDIIGDDSIENELSGLTKQTSISFSVLVFDPNTDNIDTYLKTIRTVLLSNQLNFFNLRYVRRLRTGPLLPWEDKGREKIMFKSIDYLSEFNIEYA